MKKKILLLTAAALLMISAAASAAPAADTNQTIVGYDHFILDHGQSDDNLYIAHGLSTKFSIGLDYNNYMNDYRFSTTDFTGQYNFNKNVHLIVGDRSYSDSSFSNRLIYGVSADATLSANVDGYATYTASNISNEFQAGILYKLNNQASFHVGYKTYKDDDFSSTRSGIGFGVRGTF